MRHLAKALAAAAAAASLVGGAPAAAKPRYAEGQVWEYRTRAGDEGSLLKIQKMEKVPELAALGPVYHVSVVGVHLADGPTREIAHLPVSRQTLDASLTRLSRRHVGFPDVEEGIAEWRSDKGGVFTITVAEIVGILEQTIAQGHRPSD
jgi:hypothetical protein